VHTMANKTEAPESSSETLLHVFIGVQPLAAGESARQVVASGNATNFVLT
jgi:hypothetical protein